MSLTNCSELVVAVNDPRFRMVVPTLEYVHTRMYDLFVRRRAADGSQRMLVLKSD